MGFCNHQRQISSKYVAFVCGSPYSRCNFLFRFARVRYYLPECLVQGLALGPNMVCSPERGKTEIMSVYSDVLNLVDSLLSR